MIRRLLLHGVALMACAFAAGCGSGRVVVSAPVISPAGGTFTAVQTVTITDTATPATINYTLDGSTPTSASPVYSGPLTVSTSLTVKAVANLSGSDPSAVATAAFTINLPQAPAPVITPGTGTYTGTTTVSLQDSLSSATMYYTVDGSTPTIASTRYTSAFAVASSVTVRAIAVAGGYTTSAETEATLTIVPVGTASLGGSVLLAKKAVAGASVQLLAAGSSGYGSAGSVLSSGSAQTGSNGQFQLTYNCNGNAAAQVYLVSNGGTPTGRTLGAVNQLVLVTALGPCGSFGASAVVDEVTTVAAGYALAQFVGTGSSTPAAHIGTSATNATGLANAFLAANVLVSSSTGAVGGTSKAATSTLPTAEIDSLAAIVASCGAAAGPNPCSALLQAAGTTAVIPQDSFGAVVNMALNPASNVAALFALGSGGAYTPLLASAPADWTLGVVHTGGGLAQPTALGVDAGGNVWVADYPGALSKFSPVGAAISPAAGYTGGGMYELLGLTIDPTGNVWVTSSESGGSVNSALGAVQKFSNAGVLLSGASGYGSGAVKFPEAAASDSAGNIWIANYGNSTVALLSPAGAALSPSGGLGAGTGKFSFPIAVAVDAANGAWFANQGGSTVAHVSSAQAVGAPVTCCNAASGIALDATGHVWMANYYGSSVSEISSTGTLVSAGYSGGGITQPQGIAVDGAGNVWLANYRGGSVTELLGEGHSTGVAPVSGSSGFGSATGMSQPSRLAIDASGNVWVTSNGNGSLVELVGAAAPVKTPLIGLPVKP